MEVFSVKIGSRITELRKQANLTLAQLAEMASLSPSFLSEIEAGKKSPSFDRLNDICEALSISLSDFFTEEGDVVPMPKYFTNFYCKHKNLSEEQLQALSRFISDFTK